MKYFAFVFLFFSALSVGWAEHRCVSDINYKWRPNSAKDATDQDQSVFWATSKESAPTPEEAKKKLEGVLLKSKSLAEVACRDAHENQARCLANKYAAFGSVIGTLTFSQKRDFEKKIASDCEESAGKCLGAIAAEARCEEVKKEEVAAPPAETPKAKKK